MKKLFMVVVGFIVVLSASITFAADGLVGLCNVKYLEDENDGKVIVNFSDSVGEPVVRKFEDPKRLVIDFNQSSTKDATKTIEVGNAQIKQVRIGQFNPTTVRIVLDLNKDIKYDIQRKGATYEIVVPKDKPICESNSKESPVITPSAAPVVVKQSKPSPMAKPIEHKKDDMEKNKVSIEYKKLDNDEYAKIKVTDYKGYNIFRIKNPDRIVVDVPKSFFEEGSNKIRINGSCIKMIRHSNFTHTSSRIILDVARNPNYEVVEESDGLKIVVKKNTNYSTEPGKISYVTSGDRVWLRINKTGLTNREGANISDYTERYDTANKTYTLTFDKEIANLKDEVLNIDDVYMKKIEVLNNEQTEKTNIIFWAKDDFAYNIISREKTRDTAITILRKATKKQNLVVIDAGHGGKEEPGSICNLFYEKHLNIDIALRLEECLKKKNINTYMIRNGDNYVEIHERANIANKLNARLYISVHNNSFGSEASGTETLYNPNNQDENVSIQSEQFARILQDHLIKVLGTKNRGIKKRPNLVVLKQTTMPSALVEVGFISNEKDLELLNDNKFRQKAAEAMADAVEEMLRNLDAM
ncbi:MAG: N-acetylmuramoyl-L-alanine amidase [Clostridiales bacterium]|nr:N-acetylmuramoyl-L-alanine amidase [Clostridiales bacterium]